MYETIRKLSDALAVKSPDTAAHQARVASLSAAIAAEINMLPQGIEGVRMSAMLHDIGKLTIPADILEKAAALSPLEAHLMRNHVSAGYEMLKDARMQWPVAEAVLQHHERLDGSGYPRGLSGNSIINEARIIAVADTFDTLVTGRPYQMAVGEAAALAILERASGTLFDAEIVSACAKVLRLNKDQLVRGTLG